MNGYEIRQYTHISMYLTHLKPQMATGQTTMTLSLTCKSPRSLFVAEVLWQTIVAHSLF